MDCTLVHLRTNQSVYAPTGGEWTYNGYNGTNPAGPFNEIPASPLFPGVADGDVIQTGDDPAFIKEDKTPGFYSFTYNYTGGFLNLVIGLVDDVVTSGVSTTVHLSINEITPQDLLVLLGGDPGGIWTNLDSAAGWSPPELTPSVAGLGTWRFQYSVLENGFVEIDCDDCPELVSIITVIVEEDFAVSIKATSTDCTYTLSLAHPDTLVDDDVAVVVDETLSRDYPVFQYKRHVVSTCGDEYLDSTTQSYIPTPTMGVGVVTNTSFPFSAGGFVTTLRAYSVDKGEVNIPLAPSGPSQAQFTGPYGTTNATALTYSPGSESVWTTALTIAIKNYLSVAEGLEHGTDYTIKGISVSLTFKTLSIWMGIYHNAPSNWLGLRKINSQISYTYDGVSSHTNTADSHLATVGTSMTVNYASSPCPYGATQLSYKTANIVSYLDLASYDYDNVAISVATVTVTPSASSTHEQNCPGFILEAVTMNCTGTVTYLWNTTETAYTITVPSGTYSVEVECDSPVATANDEITVA